jgi:hypothetical protein
MIGHLGARRIWPFSPKINANFLRWTFGPSEKRRLFDFWNLAPIFTRRWPAAKVGLTENFERWNLISIVDRILVSDKNSFSRGPLLSLRSLHYPWLRCCRFYRIFPRLHYDEWVSRLPNSTRNVHWAKEIHERDARSEHDETVGASTLECAIMGKLATTSANPNTTTDGLISFVSSNTLMYS